MEQEIFIALSRDFPDVKGHIALESSTDRYNGHILSDQFQGLSFLERQTRVFNILRESLGAKTQDISMIFTYTPAEYELLLES